MNGSMAAIPAALSGSLGMTLQGVTQHQNINHQLSQLRNGFEHSSHIPCEGLLNLF